MHFQSEDGTRREDQPAARDDPNDPGDPPAAAPSPRQGDKRPSDAEVGPSGEENEHETVLDEVAERLGFRDFIRRHRSLDTVYRAAVGVLGTAIVIAGFGLIPLPGPGWLIVFAGLAVLATEFEWAERLLNFGRAKLRAWTDWVMSRPIWARALIGLSGLALVAGFVWLYVQVQGVPEWLPIIG